MVGIFSSMKGKKKALYSRITLKNVRKYDLNKESETIWNLKDQFTHSTLLFNAEVLNHFTVPFGFQSSFLIFDVESNIMSARSTVERD